MNRTQLSQLAVLAIVAEARSFRKAAIELGIAPSAVSHAVSALEASLGVRLIARTTRSVAPTEEGRLLLDTLAPALADIGAVMETLADRQSRPAGPLRITMPLIAAEDIVMPRLGAFLIAYPEIELELVMTDAFVDLVESGYHAGIRQGDRVEQDMVAIKIGEALPIAVYGSKEYLDRRSGPRQPRDLLAHDCIRYRFHRSGRIAPWLFDGPNGAYQVEVTGGVIVSDLPTLYTMIADGLGLGYVFRDAPPAEMRRNRLVSLLEDHLVPIPGLYLYFPREYRAMQPLRLFIEHVRQAGRHGVRSAGVDSD